MFKVYLAYFRLFVAIIMVMGGFNWAQAQDGLTNCTMIADVCKPQAHLTEVFSIHGTPLNQNCGDSLIILVNQGYAIGYSPLRKQPLWAAYQVSKAKKHADFARPLFFVEDNRLPDTCKTGTETYGGGYDRGHLVPNAAINNQYGKLSQMETFLMSNIGPQKAGLNQGVWQKLEEEILNKYCYDKEVDTSQAGKKKAPMEHLWVVVGPIFSANPEYLIRKNGARIPIPEAFYCILVRPFQYDHSVPSNSQYLSFIFPQNLEHKQKIDLSFVASINDIEARTGLNFFPNFSKHYENKVENIKADKLW